MTALRGGGKLENKPSPMSSVLERPDSVGGGASAVARPLERIFPLPGDATRARQMEETWRAFCGASEASVRAVLDKGRSPPEIAYAIGELVHNYFRTRGVTLASFELRRLVAEVLALRTASPRAGLKDEPGESGLVVFTDGPALTAPPAIDDPPAAPSPELPESVFRAPPTPLVDLSEGVAASFDALLRAVVTNTRERLAAGPGRVVDRGGARDVIDAVIESLVQREAGQLLPAAREKLALMALSELCGLGVIDRLWADRSVRSVIVNGPDAVFVERDGRLQPAPERFRDREHLLDIVGRLTIPPPTGVADFRLPDGSAGTLVLPPAAPAGPVLVIHRAEAGTATFARLIASGLLDRRIADLLRVAARVRLDVLIAGPEGSGRTALLAALARDLGEAARVVTVARHREFRWPSRSKVELVVPPEGTGALGLPALLAAGIRLRPDLLVVDSVGASDLGCLGGVLSRGERASAIAVDEGATEVFRGRIDVIVLLGQGRDGVFRVVSVTDGSGARLFAYEDGQFRTGTAEPTFAARTREAGYGDLLLAILR